MISKVAVISQEQPELNAIRERLANPTKFIVREFLSLEEVNSGLDSFNFDILIMRLRSFRTVNVPMLLKAHARFPKSALIATAGDIEPGVRFQIRSMPRAKLLHEPSEMHDLANVIEKLARGESNPSRLHIRMKRDGEADLVNLSFGYRVKAKFVDYAQMGARVWVSSKSPVQKNDRLQLHYPSTSEPGKIHRIEAAVIWQQFTSGMMDTIVNGPQQQIGVRFIAAL